MMTLETILPILNALTKLGYYTGSLDRPVVTLSVVGYNNGKSVSLVYYGDTLVGVWDSYTNDLTSIY